MAFANVINTDNREVFNQLLFPEKNNYTMDYIKGQLNSFSDSITDAGRNILEKSADVYNKINDKSYIKSAIRAIQSSNSVFKPNVIMPLTTLEDISQAQTAMQRYIMAEPSIRSLYQKQRCDGYHDVYTDVHEGYIGHDHYDYRRVMDGIPYTDKNNETWITNYHDENIGGDTDLDLEEKVDILHTWDIIKMFVEEGIDPTEPK